VSFEEELKLCTQQKNALAPTQAQLRTLLVLRMSYLKYRLLSE